MDSPTLAIGVDKAIRSHLSDMHICLPGQIEKYDFEKQKAEVKPLIKKKYVDGSIIPLPVIVNVPVVWPKGGGGSITFPLDKGDGVLLVFAERSLDTWLSKGGDSEPGDPRKFDLSDAIAIPGLFSFNQSGDAINNEDFQIAFSGTTIKIKANGDVDINAAGKVAVDGTAIEVGASAINNVMLDTIITKFNAHTHLTTTPGIPTGIPSGSAPFILYGPTDKTSKTKVE